ncbi:MAG: GNAT family N-acetyltransferase [Defluviimonas sp.]|uniref:GNAT family N-acetyltransferase n=1 Tax=Albidovulum sp. TaxID=1872424 RepID=UPI002A281224|nr:GNAT family N-acetyltransferase [Defluviimonas sp.]
MSAAPIQTSHLATDWVAGWDAVAALRDDWIDLHRDAETRGAHLFNDFAFLDVWQAYFGHDRALAALTVRDGNGSLVGAAPLQIETKIRGPVSFRRLGFMHNTHISRVGAMMRGDVTDIARAMAQGLAENARLFDDVVFDGMVADCPAQTALRDALSETGFDTSQTPEERSLCVVHFSGTEEAFIRSLPLNMRKNLSRAMRRCEGLPEFELRVTTDPSLSRDLHRRLFSLDWLSAKRQAPGACYSVSAKLFHTSLGERADEIGSIEFVEAWTRDQLIASIVSIVNLGVKYLYVTYFDDSYREQAPGARVMLRAICRGTEDPAIHTVDLNGDTEFLRRVSDGEVDRVVFRANRRSGRSLVIGLARKAKRRLA